MKKVTLLVLVGLMFTSQNLSAQYKNDVKLIEGSADARYAQVESVTVYTITARKRSKARTWAIIENDGKSTGVMGYLKKSQNGDTLKYANKYLLGKREIVLPKTLFSMKDSILLNHKSKKIECLILDINQKYVEQFDKMIFAKDSLTTNTIPVYKLIREFALVDTGVVWRKKGAYLFPAITVEAIDSYDKPNTSVYGIAVKTSDGVIHAPFWTNIEEFWMTNKIRLYSVGVHEGKHFDRQGDSFTFDGKPITGFVVIRDNF